MTHEREPAPPPKPLVPLRAHNRSAVPGPVGEVLNRAAGRTRDLFEGTEVSLASRPRLLAASRAVRRILRAAAAPVPRTAAPAELDEARALGAAAPPAVGGPQVLVMSFRGWTTHAAFELLAGHALRRRGADPRFVVCGGGLPRTELGRPRSEFPSPCAECRSYVLGMLDAGALPYVLLDELVDDAERTAISELVSAADDLTTFEIDGVRPAEHVVRSTLWVTRSGLTGRALDEREEFHEFVESAAIVARAFSRLLDRERPASVVMVSALFFAESIMRALALRRNIRVVSYDFPGRPGTVFISDDEPASFYDVRDLWAARGEKSPTEAERARIEADIAARLEGSEALWAGFTTSARPSRAREGSTRLAVFTNVSWDTAVALRDLGFDDMFSWLEHVVAWAGRHPAVHVDVRAHPAETRVRGFESADLAVDYIAARFSELPPNVHLHGPESDVDSYALIQESTAVLVYTSTIGLEAALLGRPVLVAADVHYRGKGFTFDVTGPDELERLLERPEELTLTPEQHDLALTYANVFFYESMIELRALTERWRGKPTFPIADISEVDDDPALQALCDLALQEAA